MSSDQPQEQEEQLDAPSEEAVQQTPVEESAEEAPAAATDETMDYTKVVEMLRAELDQMKDQAMRALAEAENTRTRAKKDREDASKFAVSGFAKDLLSVADNLRRALDAAPEEQNDQLKGLIEGIEATERELLRSFEKNGIEKLAPEPGQSFDPHMHEVMFEAPVPGTPAGTIIDVVETGYSLNGRLLRPARVGVAKDDGSAVQGVDTEA